MLGRLEFGEAVLKRDKDSYPMMLRSTNSRAAAPGKRSRVGQRYGMSQGVVRPDPDAVAQSDQALATAIQQSSTGQSTVRGGEEAFDAARVGVASAAKPLPFQSQIQAAFGSHDVSHVRAEVGGAAKPASKSLGAQAYAIGDRVGFSEAPSLHTVAHEAAHIVQQQQGVALSGGLGAQGDVYEQHADQVADLVVAGQSAQEALDAGPNGGATHFGVQRKPDGAANKAESNAEPTIKDVAGYEFRRVGMDFQFIDKPSVWFREHSVKEDPEDRKKEEAGYKQLDQKWRETYPDWQPPVAPEPLGPEAGQEEIVSGNEAGWLEWMSNPLQRMGDATQAVGDALRGTAEAISEFFFGGAEQKDAEPEQCDNTAPDVPGKRDNLEVALELEQGEEIGYKLRGSKTDLGNALKGKEENMDHINCGQFTILTLTEAGWDLDALWTDEEGCPVAYFEEETDQEDGNAKETMITFVTLWMLINAQPEATTAVFDAMGGNGEKVVGGDDRDKELKNSKNCASGTAKAGERHSFWYTSKDNFVDRKAVDGLNFGVGAAVLSMGGMAVDSHDRKPGDLQQRLDTKTKDGLEVFSGPGHSSQLYEVIGTGVCRYEHGNPQTPQLTSDQKLKEDGWYIIESSSELRWKLGPECQPCNVASFSATDMRLVDANEGRGSDAIQIGGKRSIEDKETTADYSIGRLPTSKWFNWPDAKPTAEAPRLIESNFFDND